ncbi:MAG: UbiD family decarboxylase [Planctomycetota bacterium]|nr:MAG: UbiD family decarboxylase [Planctomycetota bacterium]REK29027.1 MAG: UbiD family decarboxylase [Planctomycetota bacterium]REK39543.1 MAG: UbiD family decarboxylase [Planctomycetota bacterium]
MPSNQLADFLAALNDADDLRRVSVEVDPEYELAAAADAIARESADGGPAVLFENVRGSAIPVAANLLGANRRICRTLGCADFDDASGRLFSALMPEVPEGWAGALKLVPRISQLGGLPPRLVKTGACQQIVKLGSDVELSELPIPAIWPGETGPTMTAGQVHLLDAETGTRLVSRQRLQIVDERSLMIHWSPYDAAYHAFRACADAGQQTPIAIVLGGDPLLTYAADAPVPGGNDPLLLAGLLGGQSVDVVRGRTIELEVPAEAEIVIEGYLSPDDRCEQRGASASDLGYLTEYDSCPTVHVTAITHRANPVLPVIIPGRQPTEEHLYHKLTERLVLPLLRLLLPEVVDVNRPLSGGASRMLFVSINRRFSGQAQKVTDAVGSLDAFSAAKTIVVVDSNVDVQQEADVWAAVAANVAPERDIRIADRAGDYSDPAAALDGAAGRLCIDATRKFSSMTYPGTRRFVAAPAPDCLERLIARASELGLRQGEP